MIDKQGLMSYQLICDCCEETADEEFEDFYDAVDYKKIHGWRPIKGRSGQWHDLCPECKKHEEVVQDFKQR